MSNYLIILDPADKLSEWGFKNVIARGFACDSTEISSWNGSEWLNLEMLPLAEPWILVYSGVCGLDEITGSECKKKLNNLTVLSSHEIRIFHHGGGTNLNSPYSEVLQKFKNANFVAAGFKTSTLVMPCSVTGATRWRWNDKVIGLKVAFSTTKSVDVPKPSKMLDDAWEEAMSYFDREKPIQSALEALFPLYVDVCNILPEGSAITGTKAEVEAAINAGKRAWSQLDEAIQGSLSRICDDTDEDAVTVKNVKKTLDAIAFSRVISFDEFKKTFRALSKTCSKLFDLPDDDNKRGPSIPS